MQEFKTKDHKREKLIVILVMVFSVLMIILFSVLLFLSIKNKPLIEYPKYELSTDEWTNENVIITVLEEDKISMYSFDGGINYQDENTYEVLTNGEFSIVVKDINGRISKKIPISIRNIDKDKPIISFEENTTIQVGSRFSLSTGVSYSDGDGSGINSQYAVVPNTIDTSIPGVYEFTYTLFDKVGNYTEKVRKITVSDVKGTTYYRSRSITYENYQCEPYSCNCAPTKTESCPTGYTFNSPSSCCQTCYKTCKKPVYGEWSEWTKEKISPGYSLEVETKVE